MWSFNFSDYKLYCLITNIKACRYKSLLEYREFLEYNKRLEW